MYVTLYGLLNQYCLAKNLSSAYVFQEIETYFRTPIIIECEYRQKIELLIANFFLNYKILGRNHFADNTHNCLGPTLGSDVVLKLYISSSALPLPAAQYDSENFCHP